MGWVQGGGTPVGMLAEMLAAGLNANLGGRDHMPVEVERQVTAGWREMFGFPAARQRPVRHRRLDGQFIGVLVARTGALGRDVRAHGLAGGRARLIAYASARRTAASPRRWTWPAWAPMRCA